MNTWNELNGPLLEAAEMGDAAAVKVLIDKGADVNAKREDGMTACFRPAWRRPRRT